MAKTDSNGKTITVDAKTTDEQVLKLAKTEWAKRNLNADGTIKHNCYAPINVHRGEQTMFAKRYGNELVLFAPVASCPLRVKITLE